MLKDLFFGDHGGPRYWVLLVGVVLGILLLSWVLGFIKDHPLGECRDSTPGALDGRCMAGQKLVVEDGVAVCRCRKGAP